jgi:hypothetical protein
MAHSYLSSFEILSFIYHLKKGSQEFVLGF